MASHDQGHYAGMWVFPNSQQMTSDQAGKLSNPPSGFKTLLYVALLLSVLGVIGFIIRAVSDGFGETTPWAYYAGAFSFVFMVTGAAPLVACAFRFTKSHWRRPLSRISELFALVGILNILLFIPLLMTYPAILNPNVAGHGELALRRTLWFQVHIGSNGQRGTGLAG